MGKSYKSSQSVVFPVGMEISGVNPLDDRAVVDNISDLTTPATFVVNGVNVAYEGMSVVVKATGDIYTLKNKTNIGTLSTGWKKIGDVSLSISDEISNSTASPSVDAVKEYVNSKVASLFQFKGVAHSVDEDFTVITIKPLTYNDKSYVCTGFYYDLMMTKYYKWESSDSEASPRILFTKDGDATNSIYLFSNDGNERQAIYVEHNGETFYFDFTHNGSTDGVLKFTSLLGNTIYADSNLGLDDIRANNYVPSPTKFYSSATTQTDSGDGATLLFTATPVVYAAYEFVIYGNPAYTGTLGSGEKVFASSKTDDPNNPYNVGHVYQIGEKEYASNGLIWVELGSPKDEITWLVINS